MPFSADGGNSGGVTWHQPTAAVEGHTLDSASKRWMSQIWAEPD
ncbi:MAG: hypothetical protein AAFY88_09290 [Acidobacteriota bacterium]